MPKVHEVGRVFAHRMSYPTRHHPLVETGRTRETDHPFRSGRSLVVRMPLSTKAVVVGVWGHAGDEETVLREAIGAKDLGRYSEWDS